MALWNGKERVAVGFGPDCLRLLVARRNGGLETVYTGAAAAPDAAINCGLRAPALLEPEVLRETLREIVDQARAEGHLAGRPELVAAVIPDASVKLATTALSGAAPSRAEGERMARWALRELLPMPAAAIRTSWSVIELAEESESQHWFVSLGAAEAVVEEYEQLLQPFGWSIGRVIPWSLAAAAYQMPGQPDAARDDGAGAEDDEDGGGRHLLLCEGDGAMSCLLQASGVPRLHRTWRARVAPDRIEHELPAVQRYVMDHLEMAVDEIRVCGGDTWTEVAAAAALRSGLHPVVTTPETALMGALRG